MAYYKIEQNKKGLVAKIQVYSKDLETGKNKIFTKRIYNDKGLTDAKFEKLVEKCSIEFEEEVQEAYKNRTDKFKSRILTFDELGKEFIQNIKTNLSINYYLRATDVVARFNDYLQQANLHKEPISSINVRDVQLFLNSFQYYKTASDDKAKLKKELPKTVSFRLLDREKILDRCSSYNMRKRNGNIALSKAQKICELYGLKFDEYFIKIDNTRYYAVETIKGYRRVLRTIFNEAVRYDWITKNPVCLTKIGAGGGNTSLRTINEKEVFSFHETKDFINTINNMDDDLIYKKIVFKFMILTGVRIAEMCGLRWSDIDFDKKVVHIRRNRLYCKEFGTYEKEPKTKTSIRDIPLSDSLLDDLRKFQKWFRLADSDFDYKLDKYYLAVNPYREPIAKDSISSWLSKFERQNGFKHVSCHGLRHTYCSLLLSQNVPIQTVSKYMGHSDSTITLKVYSHFIPDTQDKVIYALKNIE